MVFSNITNGSFDDAKLSTSTTRANIDNSHQHNSQEALTRQDFKSALMLYPNSSLLYCSTYAVESVWQLTRAEVFLLFSVFNNLVKTNMPEK